MYLEGRDGNIGQALNKNNNGKYVMKFKNECFSFSGPIFLPDGKYNGKSTRFVVKIRMNSQQKKLNHSQTDLNIAEDNKNNETKT